MRSEKDALLYIKAQMERYLTHKGIDTSKPFRCLNPDHPDRNPSMGFDRKRDKAHCFACGADYDVLDVIRAEYGLLAYGDVIQKAYHIFGIQVQEEASRARGAPHKAPVKRLPPRGQSPSLGPFRKQIAEITGKEGERTSEVSRSSSSSSSPQPRERALRGCTKDPAFPVAAEAFLPPSFERREAKATPKGEPFWGFSRGTDPLKTPFPAPDAAPERGETPRGAAPWNPAKGTSPFGIPSFAPCAAGGEKAGKSPPVCLYPKGPGREERAFKGQTEEPADAAGTPLPPPPKGCREGFQRDVVPLAGRPGPPPRSVPIVPQRLAPYYAACHARARQTDAWQRRGVGEETVRRFMLGFDPCYTQMTHGHAWRALIIPTGEESYVARNTDPGADKRNRYRKHGKSLLFNEKALFETGGPVFVVEGEIDALSIIEAGAEAVALGSTANAGSFARLLAQKKPGRPLLLALDNDQPGQAAADAIAAELERMGVPFRKVNPYGGQKDANEALLRDRESFSRSLRDAERAGDGAPEDAREAYLQNSAARHLQGFIDGIAQSVDTPCVSTGFEKLDAVLDGGLYEGLYIIGAISSLGKTTLVSQMADQIAARGTDVLIFSLEMARNELIAKSVSRHTLVDALLQKGDAKGAKTARGITDGRRYARYGDQERALIQRAILAYGAYAEHIFISEGVGDIGALQIRDAVREHIRCTGQKPVAIVDYLQILAPYSERATDKQNTDRAVLELKRVSRDFKIPLIGISSFNRANYREAVTMEAYKESGAIEYSSDVLIGLQLKGAGERDFDATKRKKKNPRDVELVVLKNRNGAIGDKIAYEYYPLFNFWKET